MIFILISIMATAFLIFLWVRLRTKKKVVYLAGAIEKTSDGGSLWRKRITPKLEDLGLSVFDPCVITDGMIANEFEWDEFDFKSWISLRESNPEEYYRVGKLVRKECLAHVARSDLLLVRMNKETIDSFGTCGEMTLASFIGVPVCVFFEEGTTHEDMPAWMIWCTDEFFESEYLLLKCMREVISE